MSSSKLSNRGKQLCHAKVVHPADILVGRFNLCRGVLAKLLIFALSLGIVPISSYFLSRDYLWDGTSISTSADVALILPLYRR